MHHSAHVYVIYCSYAIEEYENGKMLVLTFHFEMFLQNIFLCSYWIHLSKMRPYCVYILFFFSNFVHAWMVSIAHLSDVEMCICVFFVLRFWFWSYTQQIHFNDSDVYAVFVVQSDMWCTPISTRGPFLLSFAFHLTEFTLALSCHLYGTPGA